MHNIDFNQTYTSVVKFNFYKVLLAFVTKLEQFIDYIDFVIAFLNSSIDRHNIFVKQSLAYKVGINFVYKFLKTFYDLKQLLQIWY